MAQTTLKKRDLAIDFVKVLATLLVMNSHMELCYGSHKALATGGGLGNALFFFASGFTLFLGSKAVLDFVSWYKRRVGRIYPTVIAMGLAACLVFGKQWSFMDAVTAHGYWFLQCILVLYALLYFPLKYKWNLAVCFLVATAAMVVAYMTVPGWDEGKFYGADNYFRWVVSFPIMLLGGYLCQNGSRIVYKHWALPAMLASIVGYYGILYVAAGTLWQVFTFVPLVTFCITTYQLGKAPLIDRLFAHRIIGNLLFIVGGLCLECYLIQLCIFTDRFNNLFPANIPLVMLAVLVAAYLLHMLAGVITQVFDSKPFSWRSLLLYKKD